MSALPHTFTSHPQPVRDSVFEHDLQPLPETASHLTLVQEPTVEPQAAFLPAKVYVILMTVIAITGVFSVLTIEGLKTNMVTKHAYVAQEVKKLEQHSEELQSNINFRLSMTQLTKKAEDLNMIPAEKPGFLTADSQLFVTAQSRSQ